MRKSILVAVVGLATACIASFEASAAENPFGSDPTPDCSRSLSYLSVAYEAMPKVQASFSDTLTGLKPLPSYLNYTGTNGQNPWSTNATGRDLYQSVHSMFGDWCNKLPEINGTNDNSLDAIIYFAWMYYQNKAGMEFVLGQDGTIDPINNEGVMPNFLQLFIEDVGAFMDTGASAAVVPQWVSDPRMEINDYVLPDPTSPTKGFQNFNQFFTRNLTFDATTQSYPSRPVTMPDRDYVIVSPTDCIMNQLVQPVVNDSGETVSYDFINNPLEMNTVLNIKNINISVDELLGNAPDALKQQFVGGSGLACTLMPNTYHHFHSPVDGTVEFAEVVENLTPGAIGTFAFNDFANLVPPSGNPMQLGTDFSQFQSYQRGVVIIKVPFTALDGTTTKYAYVASIPVGLQTISTVVLNDAITQPGAQVTKGVTEIGKFQYGGSLNILLFSKGSVNASIQTRMGNQIAIINDGTTPPSPWSPK